MCKVFIGIELSFPGATVGVLFAIIEIAAGLFALLAKPLVNHTIEMNTLWSYYYAVIGSSIGIGLTVCILLSIAFECGPRSFQAMDKYRKEELSENNYTVTIKYQVLHNELVYLGDERINC